jgi:hypothetical protein
MLHPGFTMQQRVARTALLLVAVLLCAAPAAAQKLVTQGGPFANLTAPDFAATFANPPAGSGILFNSAPAVGSEFLFLFHALRHLHRATNRRISST